MANNEKLQDNKIENLNSLSEGSEKYAEALRNKMEHEQTAENKSEKLENASHEVEAAFEAEGGRRGNSLSQPRQSMPSAKLPTKKATKRQKQTEYKKTLGSIQKNMSTGERAFSKVIHNPVVEKTSEVAGSTVARPAALLMGSLSSLVLTAIVYMVAKYYGYSLSGSEWIVTFILGWAIGLTIDWVRVAILGKKAGPA